MERLRSFENHPFKVKADSQMIELQESVKKYGILNPLIVRPRKDGTYEIISGHRRKFAAEKIGYRKVPVIIRVLKDDDAVVSMVDSNLQREMISPSEKAFAYKMKYEVIKRRAGRRKCGQVDHNLGKKSIELIGEECGDSPKQVQRYIKITDLIPEMLEKVDDGSMGFTPAVQLSYLNKKEQKEMLEVMEFAQCTPSLSQAHRIKKLSTEGKLTVQDMEDILSEIKQKDIDRVVFKNEQLHRFFPTSYTAEQMRREILEMLKMNMKGSRTPGTNMGTIEQIAEQGNDILVDYVQRRLANYKPHPVRRVMIPKDNGKERPLGIPTIEDRLIQQCILQVMEPICEAKFHKHSYGFRPNRNTHHAISRFRFLAFTVKLEYVVDIDIKGFFDNVDHSKLLKQIWSLGIHDKNLLCVISKLLKSTHPGRGSSEQRNTTRRYFIATTFQYRAK